MARDTTSAIPSCSLDQDVYASNGLGEMANGARIRLCGGVSVELSGRRLDGELSGGRTRLCLAYLALNRSRPVAREELLEALWPDRPPQNPEAALATVLSRLRATLGPGVIEGRAQPRLALPRAARIDVEEAVEAVARAEEALAREEAQAAKAAAASALEIVKLDLLHGFDADWIEESRRELQEVRARSLECLAEAGLQLGGRELHAAERAARELIRLQPYRESAYRLLMELLAARGDSAEALRVFGELRRLLRDELGTSPGRDLISLHERLVRGEVPAARRPPESSRATAATFTVVFAEVVGLGELVKSHGEETAARVRATCLGLLRDAVRATGGEERHALLDGVAVAFPASTSALACATLMQQTVEHHRRVHRDRALGLRVGVHVGELGSEEAGDIGATGLAARELCRRADAGRIFVSELVRSLAGTRGGHRFCDLGPVSVGAGQDVRAHELLWRPSASADDRGRAGSGDAGGVEIVPLDASAVEELERLLAVSGLADISLANSYSVVFAYPGMGVGDLHLELAGCTTQVCAILEETANFLRHGIQVVGLSTEPTVPPAGCTELTFPAGIIPQQALGGLVPTIDKGARRYAARTSYVVFPDGTGLRIGGVTDVIAHVKKSFDSAISRRLDGYRRAAMSHLERGLGDLRSTVELRDLLSAGADSVAIPRVQITLDLVCKLAAPDVIASEAGYIQRINHLCDDHGLERLFPTVVAVATDEDPAWYLMEAVNPLALDELLFEDRERTALGGDGRSLLADALDRISRLYELTFRPETPKVARYHYLERFLAIPARKDTRATFAARMGEAPFEEMLERPMVLENSFACRSFREQMAFLEQHLGRLLKPIGAYVHGDFHLPNMLLDQDGDRIILIDPRVVWDGNDVGDPGFCDPLYDPATLLQSLHLAAPLLRAVADGETDALLQVEDLRPGEPLAVSAGIIRLHDNPTAGWFVDWVERAMPAHLLGETWRGRLYVGAANACLGWLKYARMLPTRDAWLAAFASVLYYLELGRRALEDERATR